MGTLFGANKNLCDQKSGKYKEQIHTCRPVSRNTVNYRI